MLKAILYRLAYPLFAKEVEAYHRLNNALSGINRDCSSDYKANIISTHLLQVRDGLVKHDSWQILERLRAVDKPLMAS